MRNMHGFNNVMVIRFLLRFISDLLSALMGLRWRIDFRKNHRLEVLPGKRYNFAHYGDITRMLYEQQHLVRFGKSFEADILKRFLELIRPGSVILDIGANVGLFSLVGAEAAGANGKILGFEPNPVTYATLLRNLSLNDVGNVRTFPIALSDHQGRIRLSVPKEVRAQFSYGDSYLSIDPSVNDDPTAQIECKRLDDVLADQGIDRVDLIKIDVEGAEHLCLKGAERLLSDSSKPIILMECDETLSRRFGYSVFDTLLLLHQYGYDCEQVGVHQWIARPAVS
jgi:FkbM family methyltransferase